MSASASKKKRKELVEQGVDTRTSMEKKADSQKKQTKRNLWIALAVVLVAAVAIYALIAAVNEKRYAPEYDVSVPIATVGEETVSVPVYDLFYNMTVSNFYNTYSFMIESGKPLSEQSFGSQTMEQYLIETAEHNIAEVYNIYAKAKAEGFTLSADGKQAIEDAMDNLSTEASSYGFGNVNRYLAARFAKGVTKDVYREYLTVYETFSEYTAKLQDEFAPTADELKAEYEKDKTAYDLVDYTYYKVNTEGTQEGEGDDAKTVYTDEAKAEAKAKAEAALTEMPESATTTTTGKSSVTMYLNDATADWLFDEARQEGDTVVIDGNEEGAAYYAVRFNRRETNEYHRVKAYLLTVRKDSGEVAEGEQTAEQKLADLQAGLTDGMTDEAFEAMATEKGYTASVSTVSKTSYAAEINDFLFDASRKAGDTTTVETEYYYYVIRYVGEEEDLYRDVTLKNALFSAYYEELSHVNELKKNEDMAQYAYTDLTLNTSS